MIQILTDGIVLNPIDSWCLVILKNAPNWIMAICAIITLWLARKPVRRFYVETELAKVRSEMSFILDKASADFGGKRPTGLNDFSMLAGEYGPKTNMRDERLNRYATLANREVELSYKLSKL